MYTHRISILCERAVRQRKHAAHIDGTSVTIGSGFFRFCVSKFFDQISQLDQLKAQLANFDERSILLYIWFGLLHLLGPPFSFKVALVVELLPFLNRVIIFSLAASI